MSAEPYSLDANILFYAMDRNADEKHRLAIQLWIGLRHKPCMLAVQTLTETYWSVQRKRAASKSEAQKLLTQLTEYISIVSVHTVDLLESMKLLESRPLHFWDTLLAATLRRNGCSLLLTEDAQDRPISNGLRYLNPFTASPSELTDFLP